MNNVPNVNPISDGVNPKQKRRAMQGKSKVHVASSRGLSGHRVDIKVPRLNLSALPSRPMDSIDNSLFKPQIVGFSLLLKCQKKWIFRIAVAKYGFEFPTYKGVYCCNRHIL